MADETDRPEAPGTASPVAGRLLFLTLVVGGALAAAYVSWSRLASNPVSVSGIVRVNGKPLPSGVVSFRAVDPERGSYAMGSIDKDGRYVAETPHLGTGILPGEYQVGVLANEDPTKFSREEYDALGVPGRRSRERRSDEVFP
jgi:hypothetical protein